MPAELSVPTGLLFGFTSTLIRVGSALAFVPVPGWRGAPDLVRLVVAGTLSVALLPCWPQAAEGMPGMGGMLKAAFAEAAFGAGVGLAVAMLLEAFVMAAQILGLQAGYSYALMVDPGSQADSSILQILAQLAAGLMFLALGLEQQIIRTFARSLEIYPPGAWQIPAGAAQAMIGLGSAMIVTALRLAMPVVALLILMDIALALAGRINAHLQLLTLALPAKILAALAMLALVSGVLPVLMESSARDALGALAQLVGR